MNKIIPVLMMAIGLSSLTACVTTKQQENINLIDLASDGYYKINEALSEDSVKMIEKNFPPAHTKFFNRIPNKQLQTDVYGASLVKSLRKKGYAVSAVADDEFKYLRYTVSQPNADTYQVVLNIGSEQFCRSYVKHKNNSVVPLSSWTVRR
ncbi:hypothetical protein [uncultured Succinivibrio sp.]|uniref:hypothetical protein n=1 Tax=uncultured Succinivibrio sp. TaxID=540749 RepID=UPI0025CE38C1|nr:hypothetical protein [uncultured Succinivibrio sp.]